MLCQLPFPTCFSLIDKAAGEKGRVESRLTPPPPTGPFVRGHSTLMLADGVWLGWDGGFTFGWEQEAEVCIKRQGNSILRCEPRIEGLPEPSGPFLHNLPWSCQDPRPIPWAALKRDRTVVETRGRGSRWTEGSCFWMPGPWELRWNISPFSPLSLY